MREVSFNLYNVIATATGDIRYGGKTVGKILSVDSEGRCKAMIDDDIVHILRDNGSFSLEVISNEKVR